MECKDNREKQKSTPNLNNRPQKRNSHFFKEIIDNIPSRLFLFMRQKPINRYRNKRKKIFLSKRLITYE